MREPILPRPQDVRLIVSDVDGTLLTSEHRVHHRTRTAIRALRVSQPDLPICIASGKQQNSCLPLRQPDVLNLSDDMPALHCHGGCVYGAGGRLVSAICLEPTVVKMLIEAFQDPEHAPGAVFLFTTDVVYLVQSDDQQDWLTLARKYDVNVVDTRDAARRADLIAQIESGHVAIVKVTLGTSPALAPQIVARLDKLAGPAPEKKFGFTRAVSFIIEVAPPNVNKGTALRKLCETLGIPLEAVLVFGDGDNDVDMLAIAGYSVAMGNAMPGAIAVSKFGTLSNDQGGVGAFLEKTLCRYGNVVDRCWLKQA